VNQNAYAPSSTGSDARINKPDDNLAGRIARQNDRLQSCLAGFGEAEKKIASMRERLGLPPAGGPVQPAGPKVAIGVLDETDNLLNITADMVARIHGLLSGIA
jgi:hypothetical protein